MLKQSVQQILQKEARSQQEIYTLTEYFIQNPFFSTFTSNFPDVQPEYILYKLFELVQMQSYEKGAVIYREGETNNGEMYLILDGIVGFSQRQKNIDDEYFISTNMQFTKSWSNYGGQTFGEKALVCNTAIRNSTAICVSECSLVIISQDVLEIIREIIMKKKESLDLQFIQQNEQKKEENFFEGLLENELISNSSRKVFKKGQLICQQDDKSRAVYFLLEGKCLIQKEILLREQIFSKKKKKQKEKKKFINSARLINLDTQNSGEMIGMDSLLKKEIYDDINYYLQALLNYNTKNCLVQIEKWLDDNSNIGKNGIKNYLRENSNSGYQYSAQVISDQANVIIIEIKNWALCFSGKKIKELMFEFLKKVIERQFSVALINYKNEQVVLVEDDINLIKEAKSNLEKIMEKQQILPTDIQDVKKIKQNQLFPSISKKFRSTSVKS